MRRDMRNVASLMLAALFSTACGGGDSVQGPANPPPPPPRMLDFAPIAGEWEGVMTTPGGFSSPLTVGLELAAEAGGRIGVVDYSGWDCVMNLHAVAAEPPDFTVDEKYVSGPPGCAEGFGYLEHDPGAGTLEYVFVSHANRNDTGTAMLRRPGQ